MHGEAWAWLAANRPQIADRVLDLGAREAGQGRVRDIFPDASEYVGVDYQEGPGVDMVADLAVSIWAPRPSALRPYFDVVVCAEVLEHAPMPGAIIANAYYALLEGGVFLVTAAGPGRPPHSCMPLTYVPTGPPDQDGGHPPNPQEFYLNVEPLVLENALWKQGFIHVRIEEDLDHHDVYAWAQKP
jgi:hypothetical protein